MAEQSSSHCSFFSSPIARFLEDWGESDKQFDQLLASVPLDALAHPNSPPLAPPPTMISSHDEAAPIPEPTKRPSLVARNAELQRLKDKNKNKNTEKSTNTWIKKFVEWQQQTGITLCVSEVTTCELDVALQNFYADLKKHDGTDYEPESLRTMLAALDRSFRSNGCKYSIVKDKEFAESREVLNGKAIELREQGKGKRKNKADAVTDEEEELMWKKGILGDKSPTSLNYTVFYTLSQQFGTRGRQEHHQIMIEDLKFVKNAITGQTEYVEWVEGLTKTRQGGLTKRDRRVPQRAYATQESRCPVRFLEKLVAKRPEKMKNSGALYLTPRKKLHEDADVWYSSTPVGVNTIDKYMKAMAQLAGLTKTGKKFTNHSVRKTTVKKLQKSGIPNDKIAAITGHRNEQSLREYSEMDMDDRTKISRILSHPHSSSVPQSLIPLNQAPICPPPWASTCNVFNNCTVFFGNAQASSSSTQLLENHSRKRPRVLLDSDDDSD